MDGPRRVRQRGCHASNRASMGGSCTPGARWHTMSRATSRTASTCRSHDTVSPASARLTPASLHRDSARAMLRRLAHRLRVPLGMQIDPRRVCSLVSTGVVLALGLIVLAPLEASTQTAPEPRSQTKAGNVDVAGRAWEPRGVVLGGERHMAVLEYRASGREGIFAIGDVLTAGVVVARIGEDRVILDAEGRPVTLRLGHGGGVRAPTGRIAPSRSRPATWPWRGSRR